MKFSKFIYTPGTLSPNSPHARMLKRKHISPLSSRKLSPGTAANKKGGQKVLDEDIANIISPSAQMMGANTTLRVKVVNVEGAT